MLYKNSKKTARAVFFVYCENILEKKKAALFFITGRRLNPLESIEF